MGVTTIMKCTTCNTEHNQLHGIRWSQEYGYIIDEGELLCDECAEKRPGFLEPGDLLSMREKQFQRLNEEASEEC